MSQWQLHLDTHISRIETSSRVQLTIILIVQKKTCNKRKTCETFLKRRTNYYTLYQKLVFQELDFNEKKKFDTFFKTLKGCNNNASL